MSTSEGLRVTLETTKGLLAYLSTCGYGYLMTARISQDPLERLFGVIRQFSGPNDHPTPAQFLITVSCLSFYNLARSPRGSSVSQGVVSSLLNCEDRQLALMTLVDNYIESGRLDCAEEALRDDHNEHKKCSDSRLIYYVAGYVARKCVLPLNCKDCSAASLSDAPPDDRSHPSSYTRELSRGGLLYCSQRLFDFISTLENAFTGMFSANNLHSDSIVELMESVKPRLQKLGCSVHGDSLTIKVMRFYVITRMHFYLKGINRTREHRKKRLKLAKQARLQ